MSHLAQCFLIDDLYQESASAVTNIQPFAQVFTRYMAPHLEGDALRAQFNLERLHVNNFERNPSDVELRASYAHYQLWEAINAQAAQGKYADDDFVLIAEHGVLLASNWLERVQDLIRTIDQNPILRQECRVVSLGYKTHLSFMPLELAELPEKQLYASEYNILDANHRPALNVVNGCLASLVPPQDLVVESDYQNQVVYLNHKLELVFPHTMRYLGGGAYLVRVRALREYLERRQGQPYTHLVEMWQEMFEFKIGTLGYTNPPLAVNKYINGNPEISFEQIRVLNWQRRHQITTCPSASYAGQGYNYDQATDARRFFADPTFNPYPMTMGYDYLHFARKFVFAPSEHHEVLHDFYQQPHTGGFLPLIMPAVTDAALRKFNQAWHKVQLHIGMTTLITRERNLQQSLLLYKLFCALLSDTTIDKDELIVLANAKLNFAPQWYERLNQAIDYSYSLIPMQRVLYCSLNVKNFDKLGQLELSAINLKYNRDVKLEMGPYFGHNIDQHTGRLLAQDGGFATGHLTSEQVQERLRSSGYVVQDSAYLQPLRSTNSALDYVRVDPHSALFPIQAQGVGTRTTPLVDNQWATKGRELEIYPEPFVTKGQVELFNHPSYPYLLEQSKYAEIGTRQLLRAHERDRVVLESKSDLLQERLRKLLDNPRYDWDDNHEQLKTVISANSAVEHCELHVDPGSRFIDPQSEILSLTSLNLNHTDFVVFPKLVVIEAVRRMRADLEKHLLSNSQLTSAQRQIILDDLADFAQSQGVDYRQLAQDIAHTEQSLATALAIDHTPTPAVRGKSKKGSRVASTKRSSKEVPSVVDSGTGLGMQVQPDFTQLLNGLACNSQFSLSELGLTAEGLVSTDVTNFFNEIASQVNLRPQGWELTLNQGAQQVQRLRELLAGQGLPVTDSAPFALLQALTQRLVQQASELLFVAQLGQQAGQGQGKATDLEVNEQQIIAQLEDLVVLIRNRIEVTTNTTDEKISDNGVSTNRLISTYSVHPAFTATWLALVRYYLTLDTKGVRALRQRALDYLAQVQATQCKGVGALTNGRRFSSGAHADSATAITSLKQVVFDNPIDAYLVLWLNPCGAQLLELLADYKASELFNLVRYYQIQRLDNQFQHSLSVQHEALGITLTAINSGVDLTRMPQPEPHSTLSTEELSVLSAQVSENTQTGKFDYSLPQADQRTLYNTETQLAVMPEQRVTQIHPQLFYPKHHWGTATDSLYFKQYGQVANLLDTSQLQDYEIMALCLPLWKDWMHIRWHKMFDYNMHTINVINPPLAVFNEEEQTQYYLERNNSMYGACDRSASLTSRQEQRYRKLLSHEPQIIPDYLSKVRKFVINLPGVHDRLQAFYQQEHTQDFEVVSAVYGKQLADVEAALLFDRVRFARAYDRQVAYGEIGCTLSHLKIYNQVLSDDSIGEDDWVLIVEDDTTFFESWYQRCNQILHYFAANPEGVQPRFLQCNNNWVVKDEIINLAQLSESNYFKTDRDQVQFLDNKQGFFLPYQMVSYGSSHYLVRKSLLREQYYVHYRDAHWVADDFPAFFHFKPHEYCYCNPMLSYQKLDFSSAIDEEREEIRAESKLQRRNQPVYESNDYLGSRIIVIQNTLTLKEIQQRFPRTAFIVERAPIEALTDQQMLERFDLEGMRKNYGADFTPTRAQMIRALQHMAAYEYLQASFGVNYFYHLVIEDQCTPLTNNTMNYLNVLCHYMVTRISTVTRVVELTNRFLENRLATVDYDPARLPELFAPPLTDLASYPHSDLQVNELGHSFHAFKVRDEQLNSIHIYPDALDAEIPGICHVNEYLDLNVVNNKARSGAHAYILMNYPIIERQVALQKITWLADDFPAFLTFHGGALAYSNPPLYLGTYKVDSSIVSSV